MILRNMGFKRKCLLKGLTVCLWVCLGWTFINRKYPSAVTSPNLDEYIVNRKDIEECITGPPVPSIPRIIHQVWDDAYVPAVYHQWIRSVVSQNPDFEYWLWTLRDVRRLVQKRFRSHLAMFDGYDAHIFRTDVMRYYVISTFGGVYLDLDVQCMKPLLPWTDRHGCIISEETHEHTYLLSRASIPGVMTTVLGCVPSHPFYTQVIEALPQFARIYPKNVLRATGPVFLDGQYRKYVSFLGNTSHVTSEGDKQCANTIAVVNPKIFLPTYDVTLIDRMKSTCNSKGYLPQKVHKLCRLNSAKHWQNTPPSESFTNHFWLHVNIRSSEWKRNGTRHIRDIVPSVRNVSQIIDALT